MAQLKIAALKQAIISLSLSPFCLPHCCCIKCLPSLPYLCSPLCISTPTHSPISNSPFSRSPFLSLHFSALQSPRLSLCASVLWEPLRKSFAAVVFIRQGVLLAARLGWFAEMFSCVALKKVCSLQWSRKDAEKWIQ